MEAPALHDAAVLPPARDHRVRQLIAAANERFIERWEALTARGELVNLTDEMSELTLEIVLRAIFGTDLDRLTQQLGGNPFEVITKESGRNLQFAYKFRSLTKLVAGLIAQRRAVPAEHFDYLGMLMSARDKDSGDPMTERELIDEVMTLSSPATRPPPAGSTGPGISCRSIRRWPRACTPKSMPPQNWRLRVLPTVEALSYTQQVINEALRLYPPGWLLSRRTIEPDVLGGYAMPADTNVLLPLYLLHRHPDFWKEPERFWPERFAPQHEAERPRFAYMPFAAGPRHCIGETFALYEMLMHLYKVARRYRLTYVPDKPLELEAQINLRTRYPAAHETGATVTFKATTLNELLEENRNFERSITYLEGENDSRAVSFGELHERALGILYHLQRLGARRGDKLILFLSEQRAVHRRVLGGDRGRHRAGPGGAGHQRRAPPQAVAHCASPGRAPSSTPSAARSSASAASPPA